MALDQEVIPEETPSAARERLEYFLEELGMFTFDGDDHWVDSSMIEEVHRSITVEDGKIFAGAGFAVGMAADPGEEKDWESFARAFEAEASALQDPTSLDISAETLDDWTAMWVGCLTEFPLVGWDEAIVSEIFGAAHAVANVLASRAEALKIGYSLK